MVIKRSFKKKEEEALSLKTDSFVVETNVHFPTDYNLLWDSLRKALDVIQWFKKERKYTGQWRKLKDWHRSLKNLFRALGVASSSGGKNKEDRLKQATNDYLTKAKVLVKKLKNTREALPNQTLSDAVKLTELHEYIALVDKHIDLVERRLLKEEIIPHEEKLFSIFEQHTEWITKGKLRPKVELGKKTCITTDQYGLIVDNHLMEHQADSQIVIPLVNRLKNKYNIFCWSFDKGFWHKNNKAHLKKDVEQVIMPKKGKPNKAEKIEESQKEFKKKRNAHSAVESNINELEQCGLNRCLDKGLHGLKRYIAIAIVAYNLKRIGREIRKQQQAAENKRNSKLAA